jgi:hypothetical protein
MTDWEGSGYSLMEGVRITTDQTDTGTRNYQVKVQDNVDALTLFL